MRAWTASGARVEIPRDSINHVLNIPINSPLLTNKPGDNGSHPARLTACGMTLTRHLIKLDTGSWIDAEDLHPPFYEMRVPSLRLINHDLQQLQQFIAH